MNELRKAVTINGKVYNFFYPNAFRCNQLQAVLGIDIIKDAPRIEQEPQLYTSKLDSPEKVKQSLEIIMGDLVTDEMVATYSPLDLATIYTLFFSEMLIPKVKLNGELKHLQSTLEAGATSQYPTALPSTS